MKIPLTTIGGLGCLAESDVGLPLNSLLNARLFARYILFKFLIQQNYVPND